MKLPEGWPTPAMVQAGTEEIYASFPESRYASSGAMIANNVFKAMFAVAPTPPAQEDAPVYYKITTQNGVGYVAEHPSILPGDSSLPFYTSPADDKLRRAAEELLQWYDRKASGNSSDVEILMQNLRSTLEGTK